MSGLGNKTFQSFGLPSDLARRLDDLARSLSSATVTLTALQSSTLSKTDASKLVPAAVQQALGTPGIVLNITNATGQAASAQKSIGYFKTQAQLAALATSLKLADAGTLVSVTDFGHVLEWTGTAFTWAPGEDGSGYVLGFLVNPSPATGWQVLDGSTVTYLNADGTTGSITLPDLVSAPGNAAYMKFGGTASTTPNPAVAPSFSGGTFTPAGTIAWPGAVPTFAGSALANHQHEETVFGSGATLTYAATPFGAGGTTRATIGAVTGGSSGTSVMSLTSAETAGTPAGTISWPGAVPTFTGTGGSISGTIGSGGEPRNLVLRPYFRR